MNTNPSAAALPPNTFDAAVAESTEQVATIQLLDRTFKLIPKLSLRATYNLDRAQREESLSLLVDGMADLIASEDRAEFLEWVLSEPSMEEQNGQTTYLDIEGFIDAMNTAMERIAGRPLDK